MEPTREVQVRLRRYVQGQDEPCRGSATGWCCDADVVIYDRAWASAWVETYELPGCPGQTFHRARAEKIADADPRWPTHCAACGRAFPETAARQVWADRLYIGAPDGRLHSERELPVGSLYDVDHLHGTDRQGPDGIALACVTPGGTWYVDSQASNCTRPGEPHQCWVRHGDPRDPQGERSGRPLHVDKNGDTCAAGAGSIQCGRYHGFLHNGQLTNC
jgi:hypothetical protein